MKKKVNAVAVLLTKEEEIQIKADWEEQRILEAQNERKRKAIKVEKLDIITRLGLTEQEFAILRNG